MATSETLCIVVGANENYALPLAVTIYSALDHLDKSRAVDLFLVNDAIGDRNLDWILKGVSGLHPRCTIHVVEAQMAKFKNLNTGIYSRATYMRLLIPEIVSTEYARVLYFDSDVLVTDDLAQLWDFPLGDYPLWAVQNWSAVEHEQKFMRETLGLPSESKVVYFNSGVLLMNMGPWRAANVSERAYEFLREHSDTLSFLDQDALNVALAGNWARLDLRWNLQVSNRGDLPRMEPPTNGPADMARLHAYKGICHFTSAKPWTPQFASRMGPSWIRIAMKFDWAPLGKRLLWASKLLSRQFVAQNRLRLKTRLGI